MLKVEIDGSAENRGVSVPKDLFGHNLEHTRSCLFKGLSAQIIRNRKFAGKPAQRTGVAAEWYGIGGKGVLFVMRTKDAYTRHIAPRDGVRNEIHAQMLQNPHEGQSAGIGQRGLELFGNRKYIGNAVLKGWGESPVYAAIKLLGGRDDAVYMEETVIIDRNEWRKYPFSFEMPRDDFDVRLEITTDGKAELCVGAVSLLPEDDFQGMRPDVIERLKEIGVGALRWPGGNFAGEYYWKDGLLDADERAPIKSFMEIETHPYTHGFDFHELSTDGFVALCRELDAEPNITLNLTWDSPEECAQWVEYCNGGPDTEWGAKRIGRGFTEPYNIKYWALGNEYGYGHMGWLDTPEAYSEKALLCAKEIGKVDPSTVFIAAGPYFDGHVPTKIWLADSMSKLTGDVAYLSYHDYKPVMLTHEDDDFITDAGLRKLYKKIIGAPELCLEGLEKTRDLMGGKTPLTDSGGQSLGAVGENVRETRISFDEWNVWYAWNRDPGVMEGLYTALMLEMFMKNFKRLNMDMCMYFQPVNEGAVLVRPDGSELTANGQAFALMKRHMGGSLLFAETGAKELHCAATRHDDRGETVVTLINTSFDGEYVFKLDNVREAVLYRGIDLLCASRFNITRMGKAPCYTVPPHSIMQAVL